MRISDWSSDVCSSDLERRRDLPAMSSRPAESVRPGRAGARRLVVKIGSALLVDEAAGSIRRDWLDALSDDVAALMRRGTEVLLVSSGAIAVGRRHLGLTQRVLRLEEKQAAAATGQLQIGMASGRERVGQLV